MLTFAYFLIACLALGQTSFVVEPGPAVIATKGHVWPKPQETETKNEYSLVKAKDFQFKVVGNDCSLLQDAIARYSKIIDAMGRKAKKLHGESLYDQIATESTVGELELLTLNLQQPCTGKEYPAMDMDESYKLSVNFNTKGDSSLTAQSPWGILRGLESFSQLIYINDKYNLVINSTLIKDYPRFSHRGLLIDTSRHYIPRDIILKNLDAMAYNKINVFHWHIVDDQSFPYKSIKFPELSEKGAYHPKLRIYTQDDIKLIIEYARVRGIRVIPEFDTPGHTRSWGEGIKNILTPCYTGDQPDGRYGPMDPSKENLYEFVDKLFEEIIEVFPEQYLHLGGDEVEFTCWQSNPEVQKFMREQNITGDYPALESLYLQKLTEMVTKRNAKPIVWQEVFTNGVDVPKDTLIHVWKQYGIFILKKACKAGRPTLYSSCWYLDNVHSGGDWKRFYDCEPLNWSGTPEEKSLVKGGEACMWGESVDENNIISRVWPRASAAAEKLWSQEYADNYDHAARRLEEHACRMNNRGIAAQPPNGPGFCL